MTNDELVEAVVHAIEDLLADGGGSDDDVARAAIEATLKAIREPTEEMVEVGANCASTVPLPNTARSIFTAMIDQLLSSLKGSSTG